MLVWYFCARVPAPEITFAIDGRLQEVGQRIEDRRIIQSRRRDHDIFVHPVDRSRPRKMTDPRSTIAVFGVTRVEPQVQRERFVFGLRLDETRYRDRRSIPFRVAGCRRVASCSTGFDRSLRIRQSDLRGDSLAASSRATFRSNRCGSRSARRYPNRAFPPHRAAPVPDCQACRSCDRSARTESSCD